MKISQIPEDQALIEKGLSLGLDTLGLGASWVGQVELDYELRRIYGKILGKFEARGRFRLACSRCLENFEGAVKSKFLINFEEKPETADPRKGLDPEDPELNVAFYEGDVIEFSDEIRQELELQLPFAPLCRADCLGLCPVCGADKNEKVCGCEDKPKNSPFSGLEKLIQQNKEN